MKRKLLLAFFYLAMTLFAYPLFTLLASVFLWRVCIAMAQFTLIVSLYLPTAFICMLESFHTNIRYTVLSFGFNI